jgi:hypothetical protein
MSDYRVTSVLPPPRHVAERLHRPLDSPRPVRAVISRKLNWYLRFHLFCLILYALFGKGFAYLGVRVFYVSEFLLILGVIALIASRNVLLLSRTAIGFAMLPFFVWQTICTLPYIDDYGVNVARDAVVWGYAVFGWIIAGLVSSPRLIDTLLDRYRRFVPWFLVLGPVAVMVTVFFSDRLPTWPGTQVPFIAVKFDELEAHLAGIAASVVTGLNPGGWWLALIGMGVLVGSPNRGGLVAFALAFVVAGILARKARVLILPAIILIMLVAAALLDIHVTLPGGTREISAAQIFDNFGSTVSSDLDTQDLENTREWRLQWWTKIWDYTVDGPYFWTGKGYGINLALDDGFEDPNELLRSPHNSHITFLARSGVPGFLLWIALQLTWLSTMLVSFLRARRSGALRWAALFAWVISYWVAFVTAGSFDVFLENPMAAIPFWTLFGLGWGSYIVFSRRRAANLTSVVLT